MIKRARQSSTESPPANFREAVIRQRVLPHTGAMCSEVRQWRQLKGDPTIRGGLFERHHVESVVDQNLFDVLILIHELIAGHGVFHGKLHISSNRATVWLTKDPLRYRLLSLEQFRMLRFMDENIYLRSGSLKKSCDGSHYMNYRGFLEKDEQPWFGLRCAV